jgi:hypothetical protein
MYRIGVVGHRYFDKPEVSGFVNESCLQILQELKANYRDVVSLSALAEGADTIFAETALSLNISLDIITPFEDYLSDFIYPAAKEKYLLLKSLARKEIRLPYTGRSEEAYSLAMKWVINNSDLLIGVWDGKPSKREGGTADTINKAINTGLNCIHLDVERLSVNFILSDKTERSNFIYNL